MSKPSVFAGCVGFSLCVWFSSGVRAAEASEVAFVVTSRLLLEDPRSRTRTVQLGRVGKLLVHDADGQVRTLVDASTAPLGTPVDIISPSVSYDGERIVFSGLKEQESGWRIFEINADGTGLRQVTHSDRRVDLRRYGEAAAHMRHYDDVHPCYLPDGRICFSSTRYPGIAPDGRLRATNLYVVNPDGSDLHRITTERFGADSPAVEPSTGRIVFSRWWRTAQSAPRGESTERFHRRCLPALRGTAISRARWASRRRAMSSRESR